MRLSRLLLDLTNRSDNESEIGSAFLDIARERFERMVRRSA